MLGSHSLTNEALLPISPNSHPLILLSDHCPLLLMLGAKDTSKQDFCTSSIHFYKSFQTSEIELFTFISRFKQVKLSCSAQCTSTKPYKNEQREFSYSSIQWNCAPWSEWAFQSHRALPSLVLKRLRFTSPSGIEGKRRYTSMRPNWLFSFLDHEEAWH